MEMVEMEQVLSIEVGPNEPTMQISMEDFDYYCTLFELMLDELERNEGTLSDFAGPVLLNRGFGTSDLDLESFLDEFDRYEIQKLRESFGIA